MNDIAQEMDTGASQADSTLDSTSTQGARQIYERESRIVINYAHLEDDYKDVSEREVQLCLVLAGKGLACYLCYGALPTSTKPRALNIETLIHPASPMHRATR